MSQLPQIQAQRTQQQLTQIAQYPWVVLKFGGTSVRSGSTWKTIAQIVRTTLAQKERPLVVCSALPGVSDQLEKLILLAQQAQHKPLLDHIIASYRTLATECQLDATALLQEDFSQLKQICDGIALTGELSPTLHARVLAFGELLLTKLGAAYLQSQHIPCTWLDARDYLESVRDPIATLETNTLSARCDDAPDVALQTTLRALPGVLLTQGFIARNREGHTVLLGRGGSDTSSAYFAAKIQAKRCEIWTDVPGIYTTNPRWVPQARLLKSLSYEEALEIAAAGAKVLHPRCIGPLMRNHIPCYIRCTDAPERESTVISTETPYAQPHVKAIAKRSNITLIVMETSGMWQQVGFLADVFTCFKQHGVSVDLISTSEKNVTVSLDPSAQITTETLDQLCQDLQPYCRTRVITQTASISLVGRNIRAILHQLAPIFESFSEHKIYMLTQAANDLNLTVVVDEEQSQKMVQNLHALLFEHRAQSHFLGESWQQQDESATLAQENIWWVRKREALLALMKNQEALYVYDLPTVAQQIQSVQSLQAIDRIFYAVKANPHADILRAIAKQRVGFECVSLGEIQAVKQAVAQIDPKNILFTPNFAAISEYQAAFALGVMVTVDNAQLIMDYPEVFANQRVILRIDPGVGRGHHPYVKTGGNQSKFGIDVSELAALKPQLAKYTITIQGLHAHAGSGVLAAENWSEVAKFLIATADQFTEIHILNLGGGLGVPERFGLSNLDMTRVNADLVTIKEAYPQYQYWLEPGRYLVAQAGVLLARVTQLKQKQEMRYVGIATGMNSLIRPALYGAHHEIVNLTRFTEPRRITANVVGPICESGDTLGYDRLLPETQVGDVLLIANTGAYGHCMGSHYNSRTPAEELCLQN